jgi:hypothetical protein
VAGITTSVTGSKQGAGGLADTYVVNVLPRHYELFQFGAKPFLKVAERGVRASDFTLEREIWFDLTLSTF